MTTARELMDPTPLTVGPEQGVTELVQLMHEVGTTAVAVLDGEELIGVVSSRHLALHPDLAEAFLAHQRPDLRARHVMSIAPWVEPGHLAIDVLARLYTSEAECVAVMENGALLGLVSRRSVLAALSGESMDARVIK